MKTALGVILAFWLLTVGMAAEIDGKRVAVVVLFRKPVMEYYDCTIKEAKPGYIHFVANGSYGSKTGPSRKGEEVIYSGEYFIYVNEPR